MAMGDLAALYSGPMRGVRHLRPIADLYRLRDGSTAPALTLSWHISSMRVDKQLRAPTGSFEITLQRQPVARGLGRSEGQPAVDWLNEIQDDDVVFLGVNDGGREWMLTFGFVDRVERVSRAAGGAPYSEILVTGSDFAKPLVKSQVLDVPYAPHDPALAQASFLAAVNAVSIEHGRGGPGGLVKNLYAALMRGGFARENRQVYWQIPDNLPIENIDVRASLKDLPLSQQFDPGASSTAGFLRGAPEAVARRQFTDVVSVDWIAQGLEGRFGNYGGLLASGTSGETVWSMLQAYSNEPLNELFVELMPTKPGAAARSPLAYAAGPDGKYGLAPSLVLRERPFPVLPTTVSHRSNARDAWSALPTTTMDVRDFEMLSTGKNGDERFNYFLVEAGTSDLVAKSIMALAAHGRQRDNTTAVLEAIAGASGAAASAAGALSAIASLAATQPTGISAMLSGVPAMDAESIRVHGLRRLERQSPFVNVRDPSSGDIDIYVGWTRLLRDWYVLSHEMLSGSARSSFMLPGVRIGERLTINHRGGDPAETYYVEGVSHSYTVGGSGEPRARTTLTLTRGQAGDPIQRLSAHMSGRYVP